MKHLKIIPLLTFIFLLGCSNSEVLVQNQNLETVTVIVTPQEKEVVFPVKILQNKLSSLEESLKKLPPIPKNNPVKEIPYLTYSNHLVDNSPFDLEEDETSFLNFYKNSSFTAYGSNASFFRWSFQREVKELEAVLNKNLYSLSKSKSKDILTLSQNKWVRKDLELVPIGKLINLHVVERGKSGLALTLLIEGEKGNFVVYNKHNIRRVLGGGTYDIVSSVNGRTLLKNSTLIPSGFVAFEKIEDSFYFYGGGYGHGVGMVQSGAQDLAKNYGKNYKEILSFYYPETNLEKYSNKNIRVGITNNDRKLDHSSVTLISSGKTTIKFAGKNYIIPKNKSFKIENKNGTISISQNKKLLASGKNTVYISSESTIGIASVTRKNLKRKNPFYRGTLEVKLSKTPGTLRVINEIALESYLRQVVPSEMSPSFGLEPLKVQAVAARTYAVRDIERYKYKKDGYHIDDTASSQVYNSNDENSLSNQAIKVTAGMILKYQGKIVDAKYYSTSSGFGEAANYVW